MAKKPPYDSKTPLADPKQELFCVLYTSNTTPRFFGNGQHSYAFAYDHQKRIDTLNELITGPAKARKKKPVMALQAEIKRIENVCRAASSRLLITVNIKARCNHLMDILFTEEIMDRELVYVLQQRRDLQSKMRAWEMGAKLKQRIKDKLDVKVDFEPIKGFVYVMPEGAKPAKKR